MASPGVPLHAFEQRIQALERRALIPSKPSHVSIMKGGFFRTSKKKVWKLESRMELYNETELFSGVPPNPRKFLKEVLLACPHEKSQRFSEYLSEHLPSWNSVNLFTPLGFLCDADDHPHYELTDEGWDHSDLSKEDLLKLQSAPSWSEPVPIEPEPAIVASNSGGPKKENTARQKRITDRRKRARKLHEQGYSQASIAFQLKVSESTISRDLNPPDED